MVAVHSLCFGDCAVDVKMMKDVVETDEEESYYYYYYYL